MLSKTSRDGQVQAILTEACHDACVAAASDSLGKRDSAVPFAAHMRGSFDALTAVLQQHFSTAAAIDRSSICDYSSACAAFTPLAVPWRHRTRACV